MSVATMATLVWTACWNTQKEEVSWCIHERVIHVLFCQWFGRCVLWNRAMNSSCSSSIQFTKHTSSMCRPSPNLRKSGELDCLHTYVYGGFKFESRSMTASVMELNFENTEGMMWGWVLQGDKELEEELEEDESDLSRSGWSCNSCGTGDGVDAHVWANTRGLAVHEHVVREASTDGWWRDSLMDQLFGCSSSSQWLQKGVWVTKNKCRSYCWSSRDLVGSIRQQETRVHWR